MRMSFDIQMTGLQIEEDRVIEKSKKVLWLSMHKMEELAKRYAPVDRGLLRRSINLQPKVEGASTYLLGDGVPYGEALEYGNKPHDVPIDPLIKWVERKGITTGEDVYTFAKYVQEKIKREGVNAQPFFRPARLEVEVVWVKTYWAQVMLQA